MDLATAVLTLIVMIVLFFILRPLFLWYWRVNEIKELLSEQNDLLKDAFGDAIRIAQLERRSDLKPADGVIITLPDDVSTAELKLINIKASQLVIGELVSFDTITRKVDLWRIQAYYKFIEKGDNQALMVVAIRQ